MFGGKRPGGGGGSSASHAKKPKPGGGGGGASQGGGGGDDDEEMGDAYIDDMLEDEEEMLAGEMGPPPPEEEDLAGKCLTVKDLEALTSKWKRPEMPPLRPDAQDLAFQQLECDYTVDVRPAEFARGSAEKRAAAIRMYGVTNEGHSILAHVHGFLPYFWVKAPPGFTPEHAEKFKTSLNARIKAGLTARDMCETPIVDVRLLPRKSIMGCAARAIRRNFGAVRRSSAQPSAHFSDAAPAAPSQVPVRRAVALPAHRHRAALSRRHVPPRPRERRRRPHGRHPPIRHVRRDSSNRGGARPRRSPRAARPGAGTSRTGRTSSASWSTAR